MNGSSTTRRSRKLRFTQAVLTAALLALAGCTSTNMDPIRTENSVDLTRFMGDWYVIACIPTFIEKQATNAVESGQVTQTGPCNVLV